MTIGGHSSFWNLLCNFVYPFYIMLLSHRMKLIATNISNLTDARFFAAYMPELLVMPQASGENLSELMLWFEQVKSWIEGPIWAIGVSEKTSPQDLEMINEHGIDTLVYQGSLKDYHLPSRGKVYLKSSILDVYELQEFRQSYQGLILLDCHEIQTIPSFVQGEIYVHLNRPEDYELLTAIDQPVTGIALSGGDEEKVGVKSYEQLIELLEVLA